MAKWRKFRIVLPIATLIVIMLAVAAAFGIRSLAAPIQPIPQTNMLQNRLALQNVETKLRASALGLLTSNGSFRLTLSQTELNALLYQALSPKFTGNWHLLGSTTTITSGRTITSDLAIKWYNHPLGIHVAIKPVVLPDGRLDLLFDEIKLGKIPLPRTLVLTKLLPYLPRGITITAKEDGLTINPNALIAGRYPPIIKNPRLSVQGLNFFGNNLQLVAQVYFRIL